MGNSRFSAMGIKKHYLYLGPKYSDAVRAFDEYLGKNSEIVEIPCERYFVNSDKTTVVIPKNIFAKKGGGVSSKTFNPSFRKADSKKKRKEQNDRIEKGELELERIKAEIENTNSANKIQELLKERDSIYKYKRKIEDKNCNQVRKKSQTIKRIR